jgi:hypothetical protein
MKKHVLGALVLVASVGVLTSNVRAGAQVCHDYDLISPGAQSNPWFVNLGGLPPTTYVQYTATGGVGAGLAIEASAPPDGSNALRLGGSSATVHRLDLLNAGAYPTRVELDVAAYAGNITVTAYDSGNSVVDSKVATANGVTPVALSGDEIAYVLLTGGDNEDWADNFCFE